jgi:hypothetical protein
MLKTVGVSVALGSILLTGCLQKETTHTIYLAPDGGAAWVVSEMNVRSDETEVGKRLEEEQQFIGPATLGAHAAARALTALGAQGPVRTTVLRDDRPFHVVTDARFSAIDRVLERLFVEMGIRCSASLAHDGAQTTLRVRLDFSRALEEKPTPVSELAEAIEDFRFVPTEGRFGAVSGFDVTDGVSATLSGDWMDRAGKAYEAKGTIEFALSWSVD